MQREPANVGSSSVFPPLYGIEMTSSIIHAFDLQTADSPVHFGR